MHLFLQLWPDAKAGSASPLMSVMIYNNIIHIESWRKTDDLLILRTVGVAPFHDLTVPLVSESLVPAVLHYLYRAPTVFSQSSKKSDRRRY